MAGLDESDSASTETQNYAEPYVEEPLADEEWLQNYRKEQEDKEGLARELKSTLMSVPVSLQRSFCFAVQAILKVILSEEVLPGFFLSRQNLQPFFLLF